jgi:hypothetical protein
VPGFNLRAYLPKSMVGWMTQGLHTGAIATGAVVLVDICALLDWAISPELCSSAE